MKSREPVSNIPGGQRPSAEAASGIKQQAIANQQARRPRAAILRLLSGWLLDAWMSTKATFVQKIPRPSDHSLIFNAPLNNVKRPPSRRKRAVMIIAADGERVGTADEISQSSNTLR